MQPECAVIHLTNTIVRRICPAAHLANDKLCLSIASILWAFDIEAGVDADGNTVIPDAEPVAVGPLAYAFLLCVISTKNPCEFRLSRPFPCVFKPRSPSVIKLLESLDIETMNG